ncbi:hypothetical protein B0H13DRAFT_2380816 [Mycena leptocephala]|nr:hypothetical protein B0H13DRAFT_2380816 [Mycena leptocephala]
MLLAAGAVIVSLSAWSVVPVGLAPVVRTKAPGCYVPQLKAQIIGLVNVANILMFYLGDIYTSNSLTWFTSAILVAMISRLMLNLHVAAIQGIPGSAPGQTDIELETVRFAHRSVAALALSSV